MSKITVEQARDTMIKAFKKDPDFREIYVANIACVIMDNAPGYTRNKSKREVLAEKIMKHIFC